MARPAYRDHALILRRTDVGDYDRIFTLFTRDHGKIGAFAKSIRKPTAKLAGSLQPFNCVDISLQPGKGMDTITQVQVVRVGPDGSDLAAAGYASLVSEIIDKLCEEQHPIPALFDFCEDTFHSLALGEDPRRQTLWFLAQVLEWMGAFPQTRTCVGCSLELEQRDNIFSPDAGGFLCGTCSKGLGRRVSVPAQKVLRLLGSGNGEVYFRIRIPDEVAAEAESTLAEQVSHQLGRRLRSLDFLRSTLAI